MNLSASATTERLKRLEAAGIISGYRADVDLTKVGFAVLAVIRLKYPGNKHEPLRKLLEERIEILECLRTTGDDCYMLKVAAGSMAHLEAAGKRVDRVREYDYQSGVQPDAALPGAARPAAGGLMRVLDIEVSAGLLNSWIDWLAPDRQPFYVTARQAKAWSLPLDPTEPDKQLRDTYQSYNLDSRLKSVWLDEAEFMELPRPTRAGLVRAQVTHERSEVPTVRAWREVLGLRSRSRRTGTASSGGSPYYATQRLRC